MSTPETAPPRLKVLLRALQPLVERIFTKLDDHFSAFIQPRRRKGHFIIVPYVGWGTSKHMQLKGRVLLPRTLPPPRIGAPRWRNLSAMLGRLFSREVGQVAITAYLEGQLAQAVSDQDGFFDLHWYNVPAPQEASGWLEARLYLEGREKATTTQMRLIDPQLSRFGVISDLDDTVIRSNVGSLAQMFGTVLLGNAHTRLPFPGVSALYRALLRPQPHAQHKGANPIFYVSSSPWNIFDFLWSFLEYRNIPLGPLFLRNWGASLFSGQGHSHHKLSIIEDLLGQLPELPMILIGDSGEQDPEIYAEVARRYPERIRAIYIRNVSYLQAVTEAVTESLTEAVTEAVRESNAGMRSATIKPAPSRASSIEALRVELEQLGVPLILARDSLAAASHAFAMGLISAADLKNVMASIEKSEAGHLSVSLRQ